ncbi:MBL fold metallo-hydrolase [Duganella sp. FT27W]|uniref:MBL fold metallo-hydrolase n=1 Tax=Duganella sp. FT27W TaxID=2654636 RepID=UPI00128DBADB|nr:MBL fold metallo-hydrolase [Duganella sp. FT27W]MPQ59889.1 MBL fold metallo-hydrolase [Duganella sp. FT27W]
MKISRILHAGYVFESGGTQILFDPIVENPFSRNCHAFPDVRFDLDQVRQLTPDAIFISHFHDDHCSFDSLHLLPRTTPVYLYCLFDELFAMLRELGFSNVQPLAIDQPVQVGGFEIIARRALDDEVDSMFHIRAEGLNILNVVDAWMDPETLEQLKQYAPWDMVLWPFQTMREVDVIAPLRTCGNETAAAPAPACAPALASVRAVPPPATPAVALPEDWPEQLQALAPRYVVPSSCQFVQEPWSWYNHAMFPITYRQFAQEVGAWLPNAQVVRINPSVAFELSAQDLTPAAPLPWVLPVGDQDVDFEYDPAITPPPTADISRRFAALTAEQMALVQDFCQRGLLQKYEEMELPDDSYFIEPRIWQLTVYDHDGAGQRFRYRIHGDRIARDHIEASSIEHDRIEASRIAGDGGESIERDRLEADSLEAASIAPADAPSLGWTTEIPAAKLYAGLALGESLTSMYVRIAGAPADADIADDPLIRCLFNDAFGAYQAAQLRRLKEAA